jgi:hypothetical protein
MTDEPEFQGVTPEQADKLLDLARMILELDDKEQATGTLASYLFATAIITDQTPRSLLQRLLNHCPDDEDWWSIYLPQIREYPDSDSFA